MQFGMISEQLTHLFLTIVYLSEQLKQTELLEQVTQFFMAELQERHLR